MNPIRFAPLSRFAVLILAALVTPAAMSQTSDAPTSSGATPATASVPESRLVSEFSSLAGSTENATSLVKGLRSGSPIMLSEPAETSGTAPSLVTFNSPTRPMGYGNIRIALALAKTQLASQGITQPTPEQLQAALMGSPMATQSGILQMRASGMGWGQIANSMGVKLGTVISGKTPPTSGTVNAAGARPSSSGVTTAAGVQGKHAGTTTAEGTQGASGNKGITTGQGQSHVASGAVNAAGGKAGSIGSAVGAGGHGSGGKKP